jgi:competence ComEA-like helix-hairpin-helix protein
MTDDRDHTGAESEGVAAVKDGSVDPRHAGAYGFSRFEIRLILLLAAAVLIVGTTGWLRRDSGSVPAWMIETVVAEPSVESESWISSISDSSALDLNTADESMLRRLPGIGPELARRIVVDREKNGLFRSVSDLQRVSGIGPRKVAAIIGLVRVALPDSSRGEDAR